jgi:hypothetical protein
MLLDTFYSIESIRLYKNHDQEDARLYLENEFETMVTSSQTSTKTTNTQVHVFDSIGGSPWLGFWVIGA